MSLAEHDATYSRWSIARDCLSSCPHVHEIRTEANTDSEQKALCTLIETGWPNDKATVPVLVHPYWSVRHELTTHQGLLFKQDCVVIPSSLRPNILYRLHAAHRGTEFTLRHACSCVFWLGLNSQITDMCTNCTTSVILEPCTSPRNTVVLEHLHCKSQQKKAYHMRVGPPLPRVLLAHNPT